MARMFKKFIRPDAIDGSKIKLLNNEALRASAADGSAVIEILKVNASDVPEFLTLPIASVDPTLAEHVARKGYVDQKIADLVNGAPALLDTLKELSDALGADANFAATIAGQIGAIESRLDVLEGTGAGSVAKALADAKAYTDDEVALDRARLDALEANGANAADLTALEGRVTTAEGDIATLKGDANTVGSVAKAEADAKAYADGLNSALDSRLDTLEGGSSVVGSVAKAQADAQAYADSLDAAMDTRVSAIEALSFHKQKVVISSSDVMNGYIDLAHEAVANSTFLFVQGGGFLYEGDDYSLSVQGGVSRVTFLGDFASGGVTAIESGDVLAVQFQYSAGSGGGGNSGGGGGGGSPTLDLMSAMESGTDYAIYWNATNVSGLYVAVVNDGPGWSMVAMAGQADLGYANVNKGLLTNGNSYRIRLYTDSSYTTPVDPSVISSQAFTAAISPPFDHTTASGTLSDVSINGSYDSITFSVSGLSTLPAGWRWEIAHSSDASGEPLEGSTTVGSGPMQTYPLMSAIPEGGTKYLVLGVREFLSTGTFYPKAVSAALVHPAAPQYNVEGTGVDQTGVVTVVGWATQIRIKGATNPSSPVLNPVTYPNAQWKWLNLTGMYPARQAGITTQPSDAEITAWINDGTVPAGLTETSETIGYAMNQGGSVGPANLEYGPNYRAGEVIRVIVGGASVYVKFIG